MRLSRSSVPADSTSQQAKRDNTLHREEEEEDEDNDDAVPSDHESDEEDARTAPRHQDGPFWWDN